MGRSVKKGPYVELSLYKIKDDTGTNSVDFSGIRGSYFRRSRRKKARSRLCYRRYGRS